MSVKLMTWVWKQGPQRQGELLVLLALADYANDAGECWPSLQGLAEKTRMTRRYVYKILAQLEAAGWIEKEAGGGRNNTNRYAIKTGNTVPSLAISETGNSVTETGNSVTETGNSVYINRELSSPEPSLTIKNHQDPSVCESASPSPTPAPRADEIQQAFDAWNEVAVEHGLVQARALSPKRRAAIRARLKEIGGVDAWATTLATIPDSKFLTGQTSHAFRMDLDFVLQPSSFMRLVEGKYHDGAITPPLQAEQIEAQHLRRQRLVEMGVLDR